MFPTGGFLDLALHKPSAHFNLTSPCFSRLSTGMLALSVSGSSVGRTSNHLQKVQPGFQDNSLPHFNCALPLANWSSLNKPNISSIPLRPIPMPDVLNKHTPFHQLRFLSLQHSLPFCLSACQLMSELKASSGSSRT